jgi:hypothetical protein
MQAEAPEAVDLKSESDATRRLYGTTAAKVQHGGGKQGAVIRKRASHVDLWQMLLSSSKQSFQLFLSWKLEQPEPYSNRTS